MERNALINLMLGWLMDCTWADMDSEDLEDLTDGQIRSGVSRHYVGGLDQFALDNR